MKKYFIGVLFSLSLLLSPSLANAASLTSGQIQAILGLLTAFGADSATIAKVNTALTGSTTGTTIPSTVTATLTVNGSHDVTVTPGTPLNYSWSSTGGTSWGSAVTATAITSGSCALTGNASWVHGNTAIGTATNLAALNQVGCSYRIGYTASNGASGASDYITVRIVSSLPATTTIPSISSITPTQGVVGSTITITGTGFTSSNNSIKFGQGYLNDINSNGTSITFTLPSSISPCLSRPNTGACIQSALVVTPTTYAVSVINDNGTSAPVQYTVQSSPALSVTRGNFTATVATCGTVGCNDIGTFTMPFTVTAGDNDIYIGGAQTRASVPPSSGTGGVTFDITPTSTVGAAQVVGTNFVPSNVVVGDSAGSYYKVLAGTSRTFTLTSAWRAVSSGYTGVRLTGINYSLSSTLGSTYYTNLETFKTNDVYLQYRGDSTPPPTVVNPTISYVQTAAESNNILHPGESARIFGAGFTPNSTVIIILQKGTTSRSTSGQTNADGSQVAFTTPTSMTNDTYSLGVIDGPRTTDFFPVSLTNPTAYTPTCANADVNGDGTINSADLDYVNVKLTTTPSSSGWDARADLNRDGVVTLTDKLLESTLIVSCGLPTTPPPVPLPTVTLTANPTAVTVGQATILTLASTNATSCSITNTNWVSTKTSGTISVMPSQASVTYSATCTGVGGSGAASVTVTVTQPTTASPTCADADVNRDGKVDIADYVYINARTNTTSTSATWDSRADLNKDGVVTLYDLVLMSGLINSCATTTTVLGASTYTFTQYLQLGSTGAEVSELQKRLMSEGLYTTEITGYFGPLTAAAVGAFQSAHGLEVTGATGPLTRAALNQ